MKRPAFQFYPADWRKDAALQLCSIAARGLWWEMICLMHEATPYGHLIAAGRPVDSIGLSRLVGEAPRDVKRWLDELRASQVFSETSDGVIFSRRMVRDEKERQEWGKRQRNHRDKQRDIDRDTDRDKPPDVTPDVTRPSRENHTLSSSSSSIQGLIQPLNANAEPQQAVDKSTPGDKDRPQKQVNGGWRRDPNAAAAKGRELGLNARPGETTEQLVHRIDEAIELRGREARP